MKTEGISLLEGKSGNDFLIDNARRTVMLGPDARNIELDFTSCEYNYQQKKVFAYKMEGIDDRWNYCSEGRASAYYSSLPAGHHRLLIRSTDSNGQWSDDIAVYDIYRQPHLWETWWAFVLYFIAAAAALYGAFRMAKNKLRNRQRRQIERIERQKEEELTQTKLRYFTNVSHDFLTPITVIQCIIDDMKMTSHSDMPQLEHIKMNLRKLRELIQQVLDFRKVENGKMRLEVRKENMSEFLRTLCKNYFEPLAHKKGITFGLDMPDEDITMFFDRNKIEKIVLNLLSNAYKYTKEGQIRVGLARRSEDGHDWAAITVSDTGTGIADKDIGHIFDRFYTVSTSRSDSNGVGLSLVKDIAELHHARISVDSTVGKGTTFTVLIPMESSAYAPAEIAEKAIAAEQIELADAPTELSAAASPATPDDRTMLIVEDNEELAALMQGIFSRYHRVVMAGNGEEGLKKATEEQPDIIISDVMMPVMDGLEMCRKLKADVATSHIPLILLTARSTSQDRVECYEAGADGYISKPFELSVLKARIDNFLRIRHEHQKEFRADSKTETGKLNMSETDRKLIEKAISEIEAHLNDEDFDVVKLADKMCMSKSTLYRKIKGLTDLSPVEFIRNIRLKNAYRMTKEGGKPVTEVAFACGFSTLRYFSKCFKEEFGITPTELKKM